MARRIGTIFKRNFIKIIIKAHIFCQLRIRKSKSDGILEILTILLAFMSSVSDFKFSY